MSTEGFESLMQTFGSLQDRISGPELGKAVKKGGQAVLASIRAQAPSRTGLLRSGIILQPEKSRVKGKKVYDVIVDPQLNGAFQKPIQNPVRSKTPYGYYPASQEFGFFTRRPDGGMTYTRPSGEQIHMNKVPGQHYMLSGADSAGEGAKDIIAEEIFISIEEGFR